MEDELLEVVLMGRELGCFIWIMCQKSDSTDIPTKIRNNMIWSCALGMPPATTYQTIFGHSADIPVRRLTAGQGFHTFQGLTRMPSRIDFPHVRKGFKVEKLFMPPKAKP